MHLSLLQPTNEIKEEFSHRWICVGLIDHVVLPTCVSVYLFPLPVWQQVDFNVGVGGATDVHGSQVLALDDRHVQDTTSKVVLHLQTKTQKELWAFHEVCFGYYQGWKG